MAASFLYPSFAKSIAAALYYIFSSLLLTVVVKFLLQSPALILPVPLLLLLQALSTLLILLTLTSHTTFWTLPALPSTGPAMRSYLPLLAAYATMLTSSVVALSLTSLLMYNTLRRISLLFVVVFQAVYTRTRPTAYTLTATILSLSGAMYAGSSDLAFDPRGYGLAMLANASGAAYMVLLTPVRDSLSYTNLDLLYLNTLCVTPLLALFLAFTHTPLASALTVFSYMAANFRSALALATACALTFFLNHATYVNTAINDAVAQTVSSQIRDVLLFVVSIVAIDDAANRAPGNMTGVVVGFAGSAVYAYGRLVGGGREKRESEKSDEGYERLARSESRSRSCSVSGGGSEGEVEMDIEDGQSELSKRNGGEMQRGVKT